MKKKILLMLAVMAMLCLAFAISVSAVTGSSSNEYGEVTYVDGMNTVKGYDTTSLAVLQNADGTYTTYPAYYIYNGSTGSGMRLSFDALNEKTGESYTNASLIRVQVFADARLDHTYSGCTSLIDAYLPEGVWLHYASFSGCSSLTSISLPESCTSIPNDAFYSCTSLVSIKLSSKTNSLSKSCFQFCKALTRIELPETVTTIPQDGFHGCSTLEYINIPRDCKSVGNYAFNGCDKVVIDLSNAEKLEITGSNNSWGNTTSIVFPNGFKTCNGINSSKVTSIVFPNTTTSVGVIKCTALEEIVMPAGITSLCSKQFDYCSNLKKVTIPMGVASIVTGNNPSFFGTTLSNLTTIVFTGKEDAAVLESIRTAVPKATIEFANHCDVYYGSEHTGEYSPCVINCERCMTYGAMKENPNHNITTSVSYKSFDAMGKKILACTNPGCTHTATEELPALFICKGYSSSANGNGITLGFDVNNEAIATYTSLSGKSLKYGVFAASQAKLNADSIFDENGNAHESAIVAEIRATEFSAFDIKVVGFTTQAQKDALLALGAYVAVTDEEKTTYSYMQESAPVADAIYYFTSFSKVTSK